MSDITPPATNFSDMELPPPILRALKDLGYETPTPIQSQTIPVLNAGRDLIGRAPTGTGKTAAFALPLLAAIDPKIAGVQLLVLTPTRELAIQVAEAFQQYAVHMKGFHVLPIYGGQDYSGQTRQLRRGAQVVVGTPGRVMDHMRKGTLVLGKLNALVLDEADEMLRMGFIDDIEWILEQTPDKRQLALFSATMPKEIARIAKRHLNNPVEVTIKSATSTADTIRQRYIMVNGHHKLDALTRLLDGEAFEAVLIFVRTRLATAELADKLAARGHSAAALNGDMPQKSREKIVDQLKRGRINILVATDVAARGLDINNISHVINFDIPYDTEAYVHRIGRTGRAGRTGDAILFVTNRERRMLASIEKSTRQPIQLMQLPSTEAVNNRRIAGFFQSIDKSLERVNADHGGNQGYLHHLIQRYQREREVTAVDIATALASLYMGDRELLVKDATDNSSKKSRKKSQSDERTTERAPVSREHKKSKTDVVVSEGDRTKPIEKTDKSQTRKPPKTSQPSAGMEWFRIDVGSDHGAQVGNVVGAIASEAGLEARYMGRVTIAGDHSTVELPIGMPKTIFKDLKKTWVCGRKLNISRIGDTKANASPTGKDKASSDKKNPTTAKKQKESTGKKSAPKKSTRKNTKKKKPRAGASKTTKEKVS